LALSGDSAPTCNHIPHGGRLGFATFGFLYIPQNRRNLGLPKFCTPDRAQYEVTTKPATKNQPSRERRENRHKSKLYSHPAAPLNPKIAPVNLKTIT
jgi:hypothetical protein